MSLGMELIVAERMRHQAPSADGGEGFGAAHDASVWTRELVAAGEAYEEALDDTAPLPHAWPFDARRWKPKDRQRNLIRAGSLYLAAAERWDRKAPALPAAAALRARAEAVGVLIDNLARDAES